MRASPSRSHHDQAAGDERRDAPAPPVAITASKLRKVYPGGVTAVEELDLSVRPGEIFGLLGPNGAGKSTTVGMLTTRIVPTSGTAVVGGVDVVADPARARQVIGVVSQANNLDRGLSVWENLYFHGRYFGMGTREARSAANQWLAAFRLQAKAAVRVDALSGGMKRRLVLAKAMLHGPAVVFLDEPTAGLDPQSRLALWEIIQALHAAGQTILLTTHYMEEADQFCDRVAIMDHGGILALDTPANLKRSLRAGVSVTVKADGDLDRLVVHLGKLRGATGVWARDGAVLLHLDNGDGAFGRILAAAERGGFTLTDVSVSEASLETVFFSLTGQALRE